MRWVLLGQAQMALNVEIYRYMYAFYYGALC